MKSISPQIRCAANITPSARQLAWQKLEFYGFIHFGMNTFTNAEWGDGTASPALFNPDNLDADGWVRAAKTAGMRALILTCKHHDGFCLWPSKYTSYTVAASPWQGGRGDAVRLLSDACRAQGLKFGVYLSPWDRHDVRYGRGAEYDDYYTAQLTELLTNYGDIFCVWLDGACGEGQNGRVQKYNWQRYYALIRRLQPGAVIAVSGPDVRWCGNEAGQCRKSEWSVVPAALADPDYTAAHSQKADDGEFSRKISSTDDDLGSREAIERTCALCRGGEGAALGGCETDAAEKGRSASFDEGDENSPFGESCALAWYPAEVDTSIRPGWFYHAHEDSAVRTPAQLFDIYLNAVGGNAALLLNVPPAPSGALAAPDIAALEGLGALIKDNLSRDFAKNAVFAASSAAQGHEAERAKKEKRGYWQPLEGDAQPSLTLRFNAPIHIKYVSLCEQLTVGQRIESGEIWADGALAAAFTTVGARRICALNLKKPCASLEIRITQSRTAPALSELAAY